MSTVDIFGGRLHYECLGERGRPPLLLLHALGSSLAMWDSQVARFAEHFFVVRLSMRGHGESAIDAFYELDIDALAGDAIAVLDALDIERAHWCGLSIGGMTAMWAAQRSPARVDRLVLANTAAHMPPTEEWTRRIAIVRESGMAPLADAAMERWFTPDFRRQEPAEIARIRRIFLATDPNGYAAACAAIRPMDQREGLAAIQASTLVITGKQDTGTPPARAAELSNAIPDAKLVTLEAAHLSNIEAEDPFTDAVLAHLDVT